MKHLNKCIFIIKLSFILLFIIICANLSIVFNINIYLSIFFLMILKIILANYDIKIKLYLLILFSSVSILEIIFAYILECQKDSSNIQFLCSKIIMSIIGLFPFLLEKFITTNKYKNLYFPSVAEIYTIGFYEIKNNTKKIINKVENIKKAGKVFSKEKLIELKEDLYRHNSFEYINRGVLTDKYFQEAYKSLDDNNIYIVISNTGSTASEIIKLFTQKQYNHASLSFDYDLKTIISYNGGERIYPPGLNHEMIEFFNKKEDASIIVYKLSCIKSKKLRLIKEVEKINKEGSAYNIIGLVLRYSHKPNIMFCSQFVYKMLQLVELDYFEQKDVEVKPTDLIELDYYRKLEFAYEINLNKEKEISTEKFISEDFSNIENIKVNNKTIL